MSVTEPRHGVTVRTGARLAHTRTSEKALLAPVDMRYKELFLFPLTWYCIGVFFDTDNPYRDIYMKIL
jgi:hypothetical protein